MLVIGTASDAIMENSSIKNDKRGRMQGNASGCVTGRQPSRVLVDLGANGKAGSDCGTSHRKSQNNGDVRAESVIDVDVLILCLAVMHNCLKAGHGDGVGLAAKIRSNRSGQ